MLKLAMDDTRRRSNTDFFWRTGKRDLTSFVQLAPGASTTEMDVSKNLVFSPPPRCNSHHQKVESYSKQIHYTLYFGLQFYTRQIGTTYCTNTLCQKLSIAGNTLSLVKKKNRHILISVVN